MKRLLLSFLFVISTPVLSFGQISKIVEWDDPQRRAYEPMPVICVHGIGSDSADTWTLGFWDLSYYLSTPYFRYGAGGGVGVQSAGPANQPSSAYIETFDYGVYGNPDIVSSRGHEQTFDSIKMNAYDGVYNNWGETLSNRIADVRLAYSVNDVQPRVILLCHSMGGVLAHYYLTK